MNKPLFRIMLSAIVAFMATFTARADYSSTVMSFNPVAYWPLNETTQPPAAYVANNSGTLGAKADGYYGNMYYPNGTGFDLMTLFTGPVAGATSDGNAAAQFNGGANNNDNSGYVLIPNENHDLDHAGAFTAEAWVKPGGGDPNDPNGTSYASTEWTSIIQKAALRWLHRKRRCQRRDVWMDGGHGRKICSRRAGGMVWWRTLHRPAAIADQRLLGC